MPMRTSCSSVGDHTVVGSPIDRKFNSPPSHAHSPVLTPKHMSKVRSNLTWTMMPMCHNVWVGQRFEGFPNLHKKVTLYLKQNI